VIYFRDWPEERARQYGPAFRRVEELVKPYREALKGQIHQDCFWKFWDLRPSLMREVAEHETLLASAIVTKYVTFRKIPTNNIYNTKTKIYFLRRWSEFAVLQSSHHQEWAFWTCGTLGASTLNYSTSYALETWPMPDLNENGELEKLGECYHSHRESLMEDESIGLTQLYNRFHDESHGNPRIKTMRELHREIDLAVALAYGWDDLDLSHGFHEVPYLPKNDGVEPSEVRRGGRPGSAWRRGWKKNTSSTPEPNRPAAPRLPRTTSHVTDRSLCYGNDSRLPAHEPRVACQIRRPRRHRYHRWPMEHRDLRATRHWPNRTSW
jgi:hypothetical protein